MLYNTHKASELLKDMLIYLNYFVSFVYLLRIYKCV